jgi:hypothetical protein
MSITITIAGIDRSGGVGRVVCDLLPVLGGVLLPIAEEFVPGLRIAVALTELVGVRCRPDVGGEVPSVALGASRTPAGHWGASS